MKKNIIYIVSVIAMVFAIVTGNVMSVKVEACHDNKLIIAKSTADIVSALKRMTYWDEVEVLYEGKEFASYAMVDSSVTVNNRELDDAFIAAGYDFPSWYGTDIGWTPVDTTYASVKMMRIMLDEREVDHGNIRGS